MRPRSTTAPRPGDSRSDASDSQPDRRLRYGGAWFSAASGLPLHGRLTRPRHLLRLIAAVLRPRGLVALIALLLRTPREHMELSGSTAGQALDRYLNQRRLGVLKNRLFRGVLLLPDDYADYVRGRARHALRNNLRRAASAGIRCEVLTDSRLTSDAVARVVRHRWPHLPEAELDVWTNRFVARVTRPEMTVMVALDQQGDALGVLAAAIDDSVCAIGFAVATCHEARWALHDHLVRTLIARGVRYLLAADEGLFGALGYSTSVQHHQRLLGYELRHVSPGGERPGPRRRRVLASAAVAGLLTASIIVPRAAASTPAAHAGRSHDRAPVTSVVRAPGREASASAVTSRR